MSKWFNKWLFPMISAWALAVCVHVVHCLYVMSVIDPWMVVPLFFPLAALDWLFSRRFERTAAEAFRAPSCLQHHLFDYGRWANLALWFALYWIWVMGKGGGTRELLAGLPHPPEWRWYGPDLYLQRLYLNVYLVLRATFWLVIPATALWLALHCLVTIRWRRFRVATSIVLPAALSSTLFVQLYWFGGLGARGGAEVASQPGVEKVFDSQELARGILVGGDDPNEEYRLGEFYYHQSRDICYEPTQNALFLSFGCIRCDRIPSVARLDLATGELRYLLDYGVRGITCRGPADSLLFASLAPTTVREVSKRDLSLVRTFDTVSTVMPEHWFPLTILYDETKNRLFVGDDWYGSVTVLDLREGLLTGFLSPYNLGLTRAATAAESLTLSKRTGKLYFTSAPDIELYEVDPDRLTILRTLNAPAVGIIGMALDDEAGVLYGQSGTTDRLFRVSLDSFEVERTYEGEFFAKELRVDPRRPALYVLGYLSGTLFALDVESGERLWTIPVGGRPTGLDLYEDTLWVHSQAGAFRIDLPVLWKEKGYGAKAR